LKRPTNASTDDPKDERGEDSEDGTALGFCRQVAEVLVGLATAAAAQVQASAPAIEQARG
jgi:hypothetical protein